MLLFICGYNYIILRLAKFLLYYNSMCKIFEMKEGGCILHECKKVTIATPVIVLILNLKNIETLSRVYFSETYSLVKDCSNVLPWFLSLFVRAHLQR